MPKSKVYPSGSIARSANGITPRQFCCVCICFLGSMLVVQTCVLVTLLRRLFELHRVQAGAALPSHWPAQSPNTQSAGGGRATLPSSAAAATVAPAPPPPRLRLQAPSGVEGGSGPGNGRGLAIGVAIGVGADAALLFLASLLRYSPACRAVVLTDQPASSEDLLAEGIDEGRVSFEKIELPLTVSPWNAFSLDDARYWLFKDYLDRAGVAHEYDFLQLSGAGDIAFQGDPFAWVATQAAGVHLFGDEPSRTVDADPAFVQLLESCNGRGVDDVSKLTGKPLLPEGYLIGRTLAVQRYLEMATIELTARTACQKQGVGQLVLNAIVHNDDANDPLFTIHEWQRGPMWNGVHVDPASVLMDTSDFVVHEDGSQYSVLCHFTSHAELSRTLKDRFLTGRKIEPKALDCSAFDIVPGDMRGYDLDHVPAVAQKDCCAACLGRETCGGFAFSSERKHCWLKVAGGERSAPPENSDLECGIRKPREAAPAVGLS